MLSKIPFRELCVSWSASCYLVSSTESMQKSSMFFFSPYLGRTNIFSEKSFLPISPLKFVPNFAKYVYTWAKTLAPRLPSPSVGRTNSRCHGPQAGWEAPPVQRCIAE